MPLSSWTAAIESTVAAMSAGVTMPGSSGGNGDSDARWLLDVGHDALAHERVEDALEQPHRASAGHEIPHQEPVIQPRQQRVLVAQTDGALQPPVGGVEGVGVLAPARPEPGSAATTQHLPAP